MVNSKSKSKLVNRFNTGLNVVDSPLDIQDSDLVITDNSEYLPNGEVSSINAPEPVGNFGDITAFADAGSGSITVTSNAHALSNGDLISIQDTTNYNGNFVVANATTNDFTIVDTWVSDDSVGRYIKRQEVNGSAATKWLGWADFNSNIYAMVSNGTEARLLKSNGNSGASGDWTEANSINFDPDAKVEFMDYDNNLWFINGESETIYSLSNRTLAAVAVVDNSDGTVTFQTTANHGYSVDTYITIAGTTNYDGSYFITAAPATNTFSVVSSYVAETPGGTETVTVDNDSVLFFLDTSDVLTGVGVGSGLETGMEYITLHLERPVLTKTNKLFIGVQFPDANRGDWDTTTTYTGSSTAGLIILDDDPTDVIQGIKTLYSQLVIFRQKSIHLMTGITILGSTITKRTNSKNGVLAPRSIASADNVIYFIGDEGIKIFNGVTIQEQTTQLDTLITETHDRPIETLISAISRTNRSGMVGYAFKDKYYLSDPVGGIVYVLDELATAKNPSKVAVWSRWNNHPAELFLDFNGTLYAAEGSYAYKANTSKTGFVSSDVKTKDFNMGENIFTKLWDFVTFTFRTDNNTNEVLIKWYLNGSSSPSGTLTATIASASVKYDAGHTYNSGLKYDSTSISFEEFTKRKLLSGKSIAFSFEASGTNRFQLNAMNLIYELTRRGG